MTDAKKPHLKPKQSSTQNILAPKALKVPAALPLEDDDDYFQIPLAAQYEDLEVVIEEVWGGYDDFPGLPGDEFDIDFLFNTDEVADTKTLSWPLDLDRDFPLSGFIPAKFLRGTGVQRLSYIVSVHGNPTPESERTPIDLDKTAPNNGAMGDRLLFPDDKVTEDYLNDPANGDQFIGRAERWPDIKIKDIIRGYWEPSARPDPDPICVACVTIDAGHVSGIKPIELVFQGADIRRRGSGEFRAYYELEDKVGNPGPPSRGALIDVNLTPSPVRLGRPSVPLAEPDGLIDLDDARVGVYMDVLEITGALEGDVLEFYWGLQRVGDHKIDDVQAWPIRVPIGWRELSAGGAQLSRQIVRVHYTWKRGMTMTPVPSEPRFVDVDLTVAGPVNPDNPDPVNALLPLATVKGVTADNVITDADEANAPVRVSVPLYANPQPDQVLELMWADRPAPVDTYTVKRGDREGDEISLYLPWDDIEPIGNGQVNAWYWTYNGVNRQRAPDTKVTVHVQPVMGLKRPEFPDVSNGPGPGANFINCALEPWNGVRVLIPGDAALLNGGDEIELFWAGHASTNGNPNTVIPGTQEVFRRTLSDTEATEGYVFEIAFDPYVKLPGLVGQGGGHPRNGSVTAYYKLTKAGGGRGTSALRMVGVSLIRPSLPPCLGDER